MIPPSRLAALLLAGVVTVAGAIRAAMPSGVGARGVTENTRVYAFNVTPYSEGTWLHWKSAFDPAHLGFNVYREESGARTRLNRDVLGGGPAQGQAEQDYRYWDVYVAPLSAYWLENVRIDGTSEWYGPATAGVPFHMGP